jgi:hypothetical protein
MRVLIENLIGQLRAVQEASNWMGTNFDKKLSLINEDEAFKHPVPGLHSVAEIISHLTVWRKETILKIKTGTGSITEAAEENWLPDDQLKKFGWNRIKSEYKKSLGDLIELLQAKEDNFLEQKYYDTDFKDYYPYRFVTDGMLHHDIYHLGQLGIIIKFLKKPIDGQQ